jgi:hypothetical protein
LIWAGRCGCVDSTFLYRHTHPENQELRMKLSNTYEHLKQTDTQLLQHNDTHIKLKQRLIELNNKIKEYENIVCKFFFQIFIIDSYYFRSIKSKHRI